MKINVDKATATVVVTPYDVTYNGLAHTAGITSITGVNGETGATVGTVDVSNTTHTNAGTYASDSWSFTGTANYNNIAATTITDTINKATATVVVTPYTVTYDGNPHTATVTSITGVNGETGATVGTVAVSNTTHTAAGTYASDSWSFTGTANYKDIAATTITDTINKADATVVVTPYTVTYDGQAHTATGTATGVESTPADLSSLLHLGGTTHTNAGDYPTDAWTFDGNGNYNATSGTVHDKIDKANATIHVTPYTVTYDGQRAHGHRHGQGIEADSCRSQQPADLSGTTHTDAGDYPSDAWTFDGNGNYNATSGTVHDMITKAPVTATAGSYNVTYDGSAHSPSACAVTGTYTGDVSCVNNPASVGPDARSGSVTPVVSGTGLTNFDITRSTGRTASPRPTPTSRSRPTT